jgi:translin
MNGLDSLAEQVHTALRAKNAARDRALEQSRTLIRFASLAIRAVHRGEQEQAAEQLAQARQQAHTLRDGLAAYPDLYFAGYTQDALKEFTEASLVFAMVNGAPLPRPEELEVDIAPYLNGLGEAASEMRRRCLDMLRKGDSAEAEKMLALMDDVYSVLVTMDYPDALTGGLRRTTDLVRGVSERTRGDLTLSLRLEATARAAEKLEASLASPRKS